MNYNKYAKGSQATQAADAMKNLQNLLSLQQRYLSNAADWGQRFAGPPPASTAPDDSQDRGLKELSLEQLRRQMEMERWRNTTEKEDRQRALDDKLANETKWQQLMHKAGLASRLGSSGAIWSAEDAALADLLGVKMGYQAPWQRRIQVSRKG